MFGCGVVGCAPRFLPPWSLGFVGAAETASYQSAELSGGGGGGCGSQASEFRRLPTASGLDTLENHVIWVLVGYNFS